jgi:hypothetical protein
VQIVVSDFPAPSDFPVLPANYLRTHHHRQRALIAAYVKAAGGDSWLAPPDDPARRMKTDDRAIESDDVLVRQSTDSAFNLPLRNSRDLVDHQLTRRPKAVAVRGLYREPNQV